MNIILENRPHFPFELSTFGLEHTTNFISSEGKADLAIYGPEEKIDHFLESHLLPLELKNYHTTSLSLGKVIYWTRKEMKKVY